MGEDQTAGAARARRLRELIDRLKGGTGAVAPDAAPEGETGTPGESLSPSDEPSDSATTAGEGVDLPMSPRDWINKRMREESLRPDGVDSDTGTAEADDAASAPDETSTTARETQPTDDADVEPD
jgi:hypothetical protein